MATEDAPLRSGFEPKGPSRPLVAGFRRRGLVTEHRLLGRNEQAVTSKELQPKESLQSARLNAPYAESKPRPLWLVRPETQEEAPVQQEEEEVSGQQPRDESRASGREEAPPSVSSRSPEHPVWQHVNDLDDLFVGRRHFRAPSLSTEVDWESATDAQATMGEEARSSAAIESAASQSGVEEEARARSTSLVGQPGHDCPTTSAGPKSEIATQTDDLHGTRGFAQATVASTGVAGLWGQQELSGRTVTVHLLKRGEVDFSRWTPADDGRNKKTPHLQYLEAAKAHFPGALEAAARAGAKTSRVSRCREAVAQSHPLGRRLRRQHDM